MLADHPPVVEGLDVTHETPCHHFSGLFLALLPDLLANPHLDRLVFNTVTRPITTTSAGSPNSEEPMTFYRIADLHFSDHDAYRRYLTWFEENPISPERDPAGGLPLLRSHRQCGSVQGPSVHAIQQCLRSSALLQMWEQEAGEFAAAIQP